MMPKFVYFDDYSTMPGKVSIPDLIESRDQGAKSIVGLAPCSPCCL